MLKLFTISCLVIWTQAGQSPNGEQYLSTLTPSELNSLPKNISEDARLDVPALVSKYGFNNETHNVTTEDGYILTLHRINGKKGESAVGRTPVFLMHGLLSSSAQWIAGANPGEGFAFYCVNSGYDVWMGNARGNYYSRKHVSKDPNSSKSYWKFSWHEIGYYDLPAMIDYILKKTGKDKLHYVGHSQGVTTFYVMASTRPEYNNKIIAMNAFAPPIFFNHLDRPEYKFLSNLIKIMPRLWLLIGQSEFQPRSEFLAQFGNKYCQSGSKYLNLCVAFIFSTGDLDSINTAMIPIYMGHLPSGSSSMQVIHYIQHFYMDKFKYYDHGFIGNLIHYKSAQPPEYNIKNITAPIAIHYGINDTLVHPTDAKRVCNETKNLIGCFELPFDHYDFAVGLNAYKDLYGHTIQIMKEYKT